MYFDKFILQMDTTKVAQTSILLADRFGLLLNKFLIEDHFVKGKSRISEGFVEDLIKASKNQ